MLWKKWKEDDSFDWFKYSESIGHVEGHGSDALGIVGALCQYVVVLWVADPTCDGQSM